MPLEVLLLDTCIIFEIFQFKISHNCFLYNYNETVYYNLHILGLHK